jgi:Four helix bundle sensory module for signal transduction
LGGAALVFSVGLTGACRNVTDVNVTLERVSEARSLAADLLVQFTKSADAANRAVMADTDDTSVAFAKEAGLAAATVQKDVDALRPLLQTLGYSEEQRLLGEFAGRYTAYRELDRRILDLAVENTNLKAQRLAFGPAQEAANAFRDALKAATSAAGKEGAKDAWHIEALALAAVTTVREIQVLQAPHIADADEAVMTRMEKEMATSETAARRALDQLRTLLPPSSQGPLRAATAALDKFVDLNLQIIALSRRNTNVRSLALSLDEKRKVTTACEDSLHALQAALAKRGFTGIRER